MSVEASAWAWEQKRCGEGKLRGNAKLVLLALADHADEKGVCWPGRKGVAEKVGITPSAVTRLLGQLEAGGLVRREPRFAEEGRQTSSRYVLPVVQAPAQERAGGVPSGADGPSAPASSQEPSGEPLTESSRGNPPKSPRSGKRRKGGLRVVGAEGKNRSRFDEVIER